MPNSPTTTTKPEDPQSPPTISELKDGLRETYIGDNASRWPQGSNEIFEEGLKLLDGRNLKWLYGEASLSNNPDGMAIVSIMIGSLVLAMAYSVGEHKAERYISIKFHNPRVDVAEHDIIYPFPVDYIIKKLESKLPSALEERTWADIIPVVGLAIVTGELPFDASTMKSVFPQMAEFFDQLNGAIEKVYQATDADIEVTEAHFYKPVNEEAVTDDIVSDVESIRAKTIISLVNALRDYSLNRLADYTNSNCAEYYFPRRFAETMSCGFWSPNKAYSATTKISAADKLMNRFTPSTSVLTFNHMDFDSEELAALQEGRLGKIVAKHRLVTQPLINSAKENLQNAEYRI